MKNRPIIVTKDDRSKLEKLVANTNGLPPDDRAAARALAAKLADARTVAAEEIPANVITLHSRAELLEMDSEEALELTIVLPRDADVSAGRISVLAPIGMGMLGYRVGDAFEQTTPRGTCRFRILNVLYQPEAFHAGEEAASHALLAE